ncbi:AcrR family transcriptional regulator [Roseovarius sp. MBR-79]|jgi:AcrR family transcriptional regulator
MTPSLQSLKADIKAEAQEFKRKRIIEVALKLFYRHGYEGTSVEAIAAEIGVTKPFIYSYFKNKQEILQILYQQSAERVHDYVAAAAAGDGPVEQRMEIFLRDFTLENIDHQIASGVYLQEEKHLSTEGRARIRTIERSFNRLLAGMITEGCKAGVFYVEDPKLAALSIAGVVRWVHRWYSAEGRMSPEDLADRIARLGLAMVGYNNKNQYLKKLHDRII